MLFSSSTSQRPIQNASVPQLVPTFLQKFITLWSESDSGRPLLTPNYTIREQVAQEAHLKQFVDTVTSELTRHSRTKSGRQAMQERILAAFGIFAKSGLGFEERQLALLLSHGFIQVASEFAQMARRFDPLVSDSDIFQASRNAWVMNGLQLLLGLPVTLTPAIFAYSMLYPYTDNYLDDPTISVDRKSAFNERFALRLAGEQITATNSHEQKTYDLVGMIEGQFERSHYPQVFESLLEIHRAQNKSLRLLHHPDETNVLEIGFEKGGTSVLADGYLVAGSLTEAQAEFIFGYGVLLQLADDLRDVPQDRQDGILTIYSQTAAHSPLDALANRTFHFGAKVLENVDCFDASELKPTQELIQRSIVLLLLDAIAATHPLYSPPYLREIEIFSPFRFSILRKQRQKLVLQNFMLKSMYNSITK
ncbi:MAG: hypothetical protein ACPGWR_12555 [Ardenticatenaceae bacterium]